MLKRILSITLVSLVLLGACEQKERVDRISDEQVSELRTEYPVRGETPAMARGQFIGMEAMLQRNMDFVLVEIRSDRITEDITLDPDDELRQTLEPKTGETDQTFFTYEVKILDSEMEGLAEGDTVRMSSHWINMESTPDLKPGDRVIVPFFEAQLPDLEYQFSVFGMYYVSDTDYVLSAFDEEGSPLAKTGLRVDLALDELNQGLPADDVARK